MHRTSLSTSTILGEATSIAHKIESVGFTLAPPRVMSAARCPISRWTSTTSNSPSTITSGRPGSIALRSG
jgi:hypothetical protein